MHSLFVLLYNTYEFFIRPNTFTRKLRIFQRIVHPLNRLRLLRECMSQLLREILILHLCLRVQEPVILLKACVGILQIGHQIEVLALLLLFLTLHCAVVHVLEFFIVQLLFNLIAISLILKYLKHP
jgi:hypothetical protein